MKSSVLPFGAIALLGLASAALAAPDEKLKAAAEQAKPALIDTLQQMVLIESGSSDVAGVKKMPTSRKDG